MLVTQPGAMLPIERYTSPAGSLSIAICAHALRTVSGPRFHAGNRYSANRPPVPPAMQCALVWKPLRMCRPSMVPPQRLK